MEKTRYDSDANERKIRLKKKRKTKSCLSQLILLLLILSLITAAIFVWLVSKRDHPYSKFSDVEKTQWFEQTSAVQFFTPTSSQTPTSTATIPSPTVTPTFTPTKTVTLTVTSTVTPLLQRKTPTKTIPSSTPLIQLNAEETKIIGTLKAATETLPTITATPDMWFEIIGKPGTMDANLIYENAGCTWAGVGGNITDSRGDPIIGIRIQIGGFENNEIREGLSGQFPAYGESGFEITIARPVRTFTDPLWIQLLNDHEIPISEKIYFKPSDHCEKSLILMNFIKVK
jgi:hypothetical protein